MADAAAVAAWHQPDEPILKNNRCKPIVIAEAGFFSQVAYESNDSLGNLWWDLGYTFDAFKAKTSVKNLPNKQFLNFFKEVAVEENQQDHLHIRGSSGEGDRHKQNIDHRDIHSLECQVSKSKVSQSGNMCFPFIFELEHIY